jgi:hypothetical protein
MTAKEDVHTKYELLVLSHAVCVALACTKSTCAPTYSRSALSEDMLQDADLRTG